MSTRAGRIDVLVVEPDDQLGETYQRVLNDAGVKVKRVQNAEEALVKLEASNPRLMTLEVQLPGHNGIELLHEMRSYSDWRSIPVLFMTIVPEAELGLSQHEEGVIGHCYKPQTSLQQLTDTVLSALEQLS